MSGLSLCPAVRLWFAGKTVSSGPAPLPFAALAVLGLTQRWRAGSGPAAFGAGEEAFPFRLLLLFLLQTWVWVGKGQAFFLLPLELQRTVAQNLGTSYISSHPLFRFHCVNHLHICNSVNAPSAQCLEKGRKRISKVWKADRASADRGELSVVLKLSKRLSPPLHGVRLHIFIPGFLVPPCLG